MGACLIDDSIALFLLSVNQQTGNEQALNMKENLTGTMTFIEVGGNSGCFCYFLLFCFLSFYFF